MTRSMHGAFDLPDLSWSQLRAFEASARFGSFNNAAAALGLTAAAVRFQVSLLEKRLDVRLFDRKGGRLEPTASGAAFARKIAQPMRELAAACELAKEVAEAEPITLTAPPLFARHFLFDPRFLKWCDDQSVRLDVSDIKRDLSGRSPIAAIRMGATVEKGLVAKDILDVSLIIAGSPGLAANARPREAGWWKEQTLIKVGISDTAWKHAWSELGLGEIAPRNAHRFSNYAAALEAAVLGRGIVLAPLPFANVELGLNRLKRISKAEIRSKPAFSLVMRTDLAGSPRGRALARKIAGIAQNDPTMRSKPPGRT